MESNLATEILKLRQKLTEKDEELVLAGHYGKSLLDANSHLEDVLSQTNSDYEKKCDDFEQLKYSSETKISELQYSEQQLRKNHVEEKQSLCEKHQKELKLRQKAHEEAESGLTEKIKDIQKELDGNVMINEKLKEKLKEQQDTIANLRASLQKKTAGNLPPKTEEVLCEKMKLAEKLASAEGLCNDLHRDVEELSLKEEELKQSNKYYQEENERMRNDLLQSSENLEELQLENFNLKNELEALCSRPQDPNSRGNSLFAEVDDKRQQAEKKLISAQVKLKCLEKNLTQQVNYAMKLKSQIAQLLHTGGREADRERISRLEIALACAQSDVNSRNSKIAELEKKTPVNAFEFTRVESTTINTQKSTNLSALKTISAKLEEKINEMKSSENPNSDFVEFLEKLVTKKDTEITNLNQELQKCQIDLLAESRRANEADREIYSAQCDRDKLKAQAIKLKTEISRLKLKCGEEVQGKRNMRPRKIEKIPTDSESLEGNENLDPIINSQKEAVCQPVTSGRESGVESMVDKHKPKSASYGLTEAPAECKQQ